MSRKREGRNEGASVQEPEVKTIPVGWIVRHPKLRMRIKTRQQKVMDYARAMRAGARFPPLEIVKDGEAYLLVDGFHRYEALMHNRADRAEAHITEGDIRRATVMAATANTKHGMGWTPRELRGAFSAYMKAKGFINEDNGQAKSYQEVADDFGGIKSRWTIGRWIKTKHKSVYERYYRAGEVIGEQQWEGDTMKGIGYGRETVIALDRALALFKGVRDPEQRGAIIAQAEHTLEEMKNGGPWKLPVEEF